MTLGKLSIPAGYQIVDPLVTSLAPGRSDLFSLRLITKTAGGFSGLVSFPTNVSGKNPFEFSIVGRVTAK